MRILIVGAGPGGLYAGILLKKANPDHEIEIYERNPEGATYGWGVVFSDRTLDSFREADYPTYQRITDSFVHWTDIDIHFRNHVIRAGGHDFAGMSRRTLLAILQDRCRELGVALHFDTDLDLRDSAPFTEVYEPEETAGDRQNDSRNYSTIGRAVAFDSRQFDLVIAADGVNSRIRTQFSAAFGPSLLTGTARYIWFGTDRLLDAFTFLFKETEFGMFQVHAYPFDGQTSTFIVECPEEVWQRAGLEEAGEDGNSAFCHDLFADFLGSSRLLSNRSQWINFLRVKTKTWRYQNIALLGDAAHTAHFSIGSGTKLAMDGAIALAQAFELAPDIDAALRLYEMDRRPRVDALQTAAQESQTYFETISRYAGLKPQQFAFHLLTRSGRIHYDNLRTRDPHYVEAVDSWYSADNQARQSAIAPPPMFTPFSLRSMTLTNRVVIRSGDSDSIPAGAGLIVTPPVAVSPEGRIAPDDLCLYDEEHIDIWKSKVDSIHSSLGAKIALTLNHAGRRGSTRPREFGLDRPLADGGWTVFAPTTTPFHQSSPIPRMMTSGDLQKTKDAFVRAAQMAVQAGFDMLHLHCGHGYLLGSFLSALTNHRDDQYGGTLEKRMVYPLEVFEAIRESWPADRPLAVALNVDDWAAGGTTVDEAITVAMALMERGCDMIEVLAGQTISNEKPAYSPGYLTAYASRLRLAAEIPVLVGGYLRTSGEVNTILAGGRADLCVLNLD